MPGSSGASRRKTLGKSRLRQLARFHPRGIAGRAYWWVLLPIHKVIWKQLAERLVASAEQSS